MFDLHEAIFQKRKKKFSLSTFPLEVYINNQFAALSRILRHHINVSHVILRQDVSASLC